MKRFILLIAFIHYVSVLFSQHVSETDALHKAQAFIHGKVAATTENKHFTRHNTVQLSMIEQNDAYYIFNVEDNGGFVIVSGDERTDDILGYSTEGNINLAKMPENMKEWLKGYEKQILAIPAGARAASTKVSTHPAVEPLITSKWNQYAPYNLQCPEEIPEGGTEPQHCLTGCVATAMAQIMYYHKWPQNYTAAIPAYEYDNAGWDEVTQTLIYNKSLPGLPPTKFDWDHMKDTYNGDETDASADAVAELMRYCGQSVKMNYGLEGSGAGPNPESLINYFGYDNGAVTKYQYSDGYSIAEWDALIYNEISEGRPVWYAGGNISMSHSFVCDGYDGMGSFHINWGWGGFNDGYFKLSVHSPSDYLSNQSAVIGIQRPTGSNNYVYRMYAYISDNYDSNGENVFSSFFINESSQDGTFDGGLLIEGIGDTEYYLIYTLFSNKVIRREGGPLNYDTYISSLCLPDGDYRIKPVMKQSSDWEWYKNNNHYYNFSIVDGIVSSMSEGPVINADINIEPSGNLTTNEHQRLNVKVKNHGGEINRAVYLFVSKTEDMGTAQAVNSLAVEEKSEGSTFFDYSFSEEGLYHVWITNSQYTENSDFAILAQTDLSIRKPLKISMHGDTFDWSTMTMSVTVTNNDDVPYEREVAVRILERELDFNNMDVGVLFKSEKLCIEPGSSIDLEIPCPGIDIDRLYRARLQYYKNPTNDFLSDDRIVCMRPNTISRFKIDGVRYRVVDTNHYYVFASLYYNDVEENLVIPSTVVSPTDGMTYKVKGIDENFCMYNNVKTVTLSEGITTIECYSFSQCEKLTTLSLPKSINSIGYYMIYQCPNLSSIYIKKDNAPLIVDNGKSEYLIGPVKEHSNVTLYVPVGSKESYAKTWPLFTNIVEMSTPFPALIPLTVGVEDMTVTLGSFVENVDAAQYDFDDGGMMMGWGNGQMMSIVEGSYDGSYYLTATNPKTVEFWENQIASDFAPLVPEEEYLLHFWAKANKSFWMEACLQYPSEEADWPVCGDFGRKEISTEWQEYTLITKVTGRNASRLIFNIGELDNGTFCIDNVTLRRKNPQFKLTYNGFVDGDNETTAFSTLPVATTTATNDSPAGTYPIIISGGVSEKYNIIYQPGTLTIVAPVYGDANGDSQVNIADIVEMVNACNGHASIRFNKINADMDGNGSIDQDDIDAVVKLIIRK